jgi:hypothetical protein
MKSAKNDVTGDSIRTKATTTDAYAKGWDRVFKKKATRSRSSQCAKSVGKANSKSV